MDTKAAMKINQIVEVHEENSRDCPVAVDLQRVFPGRTLVLAAHPDDELGLCAALLLRMMDTVVVISTDGAPADEWFWKRWGSAENYAAMRRREAESALGAVVGHLVFLNDWTGTPGTQFHDQQLYKILPEAFRCVGEVVERYRPDSVIVPAYEGGHPDHDACGFMGWLLRTRFGLPVWESPLYHRSAGGQLVCQRFRQPNGTEVAIELTNRESVRRAEIAAKYCSQGNILPFVSTRVELYRPQADYDYSQPPHPGTVNYEAWGWPITPREVCLEFQHFTASWPPG